MLASGAMGIMQKIQQNSSVKDERGSFLFLAFITASAISVIGVIFAKDKELHTKKKILIIPASAGICFALCNLINTHLVGILPSAVFFPMLNIGAIFASLILGVALYHERVTKKDALILSLGAVAILLINLK